MKIRMLLVPLVMAAVVSMIALTGCSEREEVAEAPQPREMSQRVEATAEEQGTKETTVAAAGTVDMTAAEEAFEKHCASCHPDGGNIMNSEKTLKTDSLESSGITTPEGIVDVMRNPGQGMPSYDQETIPDDLALAMGRYILETF